MTQSTKSRGRKPAKPHPDFPLFPHATGRWAKKVKGKLHYFGPWNDPQGALERWLEVKDDLLAGRTRRDTSSGLTVRELCNRFLTSKTHLLDSGEILPRTWQEYHGACERIVGAFGRTTRVADLDAEDFRRLRTCMAKTLGPVGLGNEINRVRMVFKFAVDEGLIDKPIRYGQGFKRPSKRTLRKARAANGKRMFEAKELRQIIETAPQPLKAMVLLGINAGFGQTDLAQMPISAVNLESGWVDYPRPKTGIGRRCPLWRETVEALREAMEHRPQPNEANEDVLFLTHHGKRWVRLNRSNTPNDEIGKQFARLLKALGLKRPGVSFYALRHTFETIAGDSRDQVAVDHIMGHTRDDMASVYRERISDERLIAVTNYVREWLFGDHSGAGTRPAIGQS